MKTKTTLTLLFSVFLTCSLMSQTTLISQGSSWNYYDAGNEPPDQSSLVWYDTTYDDNSWSSGNAHLGYGDGDETTVIANNPTYTAYFRHEFNVSNPGSFANLGLQLTYDDGAVVYLNGIEVLRVNMPTGAIDYNTFASGTASDNSIFSANISNTLNAGSNQLSVEIHQRSSGSSDISFDFELTGLPPGAIIVQRGPYLQKSTPGSMTVRWRTDTPTESVVNYGTTEGSLNFTASDLTPKTEHILEIGGLSANTVYYYDVGNSATVLIAGSPEMYFKTAPNFGTVQPLRAWVLGDCGTANNNQRAVRDAYNTYSGGDHTDMILFLGDNAYNSGTDNEYQFAIFENMYEDNLRNTVAWSCLGNHDGYSANSSNQSGPYYDIFTFPTNGESGGTSSGTEAYYSFDQGNVHFISLESYETDRSVGGSMYDWCESDLQNTTADWIVAFWHHPPYTKGSHDSDSESELIEMRENFLPLLESYGVDLVLSGHSHSYERSYFLSGHHGNSNSFSAPTHTVGANGDGDGQIDGDGAYEKEITGPNEGEGAVYITAGSSGKTSGGSLDHEAMYYSVSQLGSCVLEISNDTLTVKFLRETGSIDDYFSIIKSLNCTPGAACDDLDPCTTNDVYDVSCNCNGTFQDTDSDGVCDAEDVCPGSDDNVDSDGDGTPDGCDACPNSATGDTDGDGVCDDVDTCPGSDDNVDSDGDGVADGCDVCPGADDNVDTDGDGVADGCDACPGSDDNVDSDGDGVADGCDVCPGSDDNVDTDGDGVADGCDTCPGSDDNVDTDGDGVADGCDACPGSDDNADADGDGVADGCDACPGFDDNVDTDGDGVADGCDVCPGSDDNVDTDGDGVADGCDACPGADDNVDTDGDGVADGCDACPGSDDNADADGDGVADGCDVCPGADDNVDTDGDGVADGCDLCPGSDDNVDTDGDGVADGCDTCPGADDNADADGDGVADGCDTCPGFNDNADADGDGVADGCDVCPGSDDNVDTDGDGVADGCDACPGSDDNVDADGDGVADGCDTCPGFDDTADADGDGVADGCDTCPGSDDNADADGDGVADGCDVCPGSDDNVDSDGDGVADGCDACPGADDNADADGDGVADGCDVCPGSDDNADADQDGIPDACDACPNSATGDSDGDGVCDDVDICPGSDDTVDTDGDGIPDGCDPCPTSVSDDSDGDGVCDDVDVCPGSDDNLDADGDGVPDGCDICPGSDDAIDSDGDGTPDGCDLCEGSDDAIDSDGDGTPDGCDLCEGSDDALDADSDGVPDGCDICAGSDDNVDSDGDGVPDGCDICAGSDDNVDSDGDGVPDGCDICAGSDDALDADSDGVPDGCDICAGSDDNVDSDGDGVPNGCDICPGSDDAIDSDGDGTPDGCDLCEGSNDALDGDSDGVPDGCDICAGSDDALDTDSDGVPDGCDICAGSDDNVDSDGDGVPNGCDICAGSDDNVDSDGDGIPDGCDICAGSDDNVDSDGDGTPDGCDICAGSDDNVDSDGDGTPDGCDACPNSATGDSDGDGVCDDSDICPGSDDNIDSDSDGTPDGCDACPNSATGDSDGDGVCDDLDICAGSDDNVDSDSDGTPDGCDACPNSAAGDTDNDGDGYCGSDDPDDSDPCNPDSNSPICDPCSEFNSESYESGDGIWNDGGSDCTRRTEFPNTGNYSVRIRDNSGSSSSMYTDVLDLTGVGEVVFDFSYYALDMEDNEDFFLEISTNGGSSYSVYQEWNKGVEFENGIRYYESLNISYAFTNNTRFRLRCDASVNNDRVYIDDVVIQVCDISCNAGAPCDDNDDCTVGDVYDVNCNCNGTYQDSDGDGVCDAEDQCPGQDDDLIGTACDDLDDCTTGDVYDGNCECEGSYTDQDGDGYCIGDDPDDSDPCNPDPNGPGCGDCPEIISDGFESGFGNWNDGGNDCHRRVEYANTGSYSIRIRDNVGSASSMYTDDMALANYSTVTIEFSWIAISMENNEDFMLEVSTNGGSSYSIIESWVRGTDFENSIRYNESIDISTSFTNNTRFRFRCDASGNGDKIFIDDVVIKGCPNQSRDQSVDQVVQSTPLDHTSLIINEEEAQANSISREILVYPNPASNNLYMDLSQFMGEAGSLLIYNIQGTPVTRYYFDAEHEALVHIPIDNLHNGVYLLNIELRGAHLKTQRLIITK